MLLSKITPKLRKLVDGVSSSTIVSLQWLPTMWDGCCRELNQISCVSSEFVLYRLLPIHLSKASIQAHNNCRGIASTTMNLKVQIIYITMYATTKRLSDAYDVSSVQTEELWSGY